MDVDYKWYLLNLKLTLFLFFHVTRLNNKRDLQKYGQVILDFSYFNNTNEIEKKIVTNPVRIVEINC